MPERILDRMNDQEVRDIFAYIMKKNWFCYSTKSLNL
jgi:hypothetical protein